ncbi:MAG: hypothetical protein SXG53_13565 [Pseudomonadota bacterium]|nr:hypothetical protein [Pseudomonadota bacterium]
MLWIFLLLIHGLCAVALLGALTHQSVSVVYRSRPKRDLIRSFGAVRSNIYTNTIVALYIVTFALGGWIYAPYRYMSRPVLEDLGFFQAVALFDLKEHVAAVCLFLIPAYWLLWARVPLSQSKHARAALTILLAVGSWFSFVVGHVLNNFRGI